MWPEILFDLYGVAILCFLCRGLDLQRECEPQENPPCGRRKQESPALPRTLRPRLPETATVPARAASLPIVGPPRSEVM